MLLNKDVSIAVSTNRCGVTSRVISVVLCHGLFLWCYDTGCFGGVMSRVVSVVLCYGLFLWCYVTGCFCGVMSRVVSGNPGPRSRNAMTNRLTKLGMFAVC